MQAKVATMPQTGADVRYLFDLSARKEEDTAYIVKTVLQELREKTWQLDFLADTVAPSPTRL